MKKKIQDKIYTEQTRCCVILSIYSKLNLAEIPTVDKLMKSPRVLGVHRIVYSLHDKKIDTNFAQKIHKAQSHKYKENARHTLFIQ